MRDTEGETMFAKWLREQLDRRGWDAERLAEETGLSRSHIYKLISPAYQPQPQRKTVMRIADALGVPYGEALRAAGYSTSASYLADSHGLVAEIMSILRDVPEPYYASAVNFFRTQAEVAKELFLKDQKEHVGVE